MNLLFSKLITKGKSLMNKSNNEHYEKEEHMRQEQKLMVGIDQFTLKIYCNTSSSWNTMAKQVIDIFVEKAEFREIHWIESQETHGCSRGYTKAMYICANIGCKVLVEWNHVKSDLGIRIHFSAHAWAEYQYAFWNKNVEMDFLTFLKRIQCEEYEVTANRIDLTADYQNYPKCVQPDSINRNIREGTLCIKDSSGRASYRKAPTTIWNGNSCNTITIGSYRGNIGHYMRIYDKKEEAISNNSFRAKEASKCKNWVRFEVVFLRQDAKDLVERMLREVSSVGCTGYTAWINHLFGNQYTMERRVKYFFYLMAQAVIENSSYQESMFEEGLHDICPRVKESALDKCDIIDLTLIQMGAGEIDIFAKNLREIGEIEMYEYVKDICACKESILRYFDNEEPETTEERIWDLLELEIKVRKAYENTPLDPVAEIAEYTLFLPARVIVYLTAECVDQDFWEMWEDIGETVYDDEIRKQYELDADRGYRKEVMDAPIEPISTATFLSAYGTFYETDADRLYWWDGTKEVIISDELELWLQSLKKKYIEILKKTSQSTIRTDQFLKSFMKL